MSHARPKRLDADASHCGVRRYRLRVFKRDGRDVYGARVRSGSLRDMCAQLLRLFPPSTKCCMVAPGRYVIGGGLAELEVMDAD